jgi:hypothetical protein
MRLGHKIVFLHCALLSIGVVGYSQDSAAISSGLDGNWRITGNEDAAPPQYPALDFSFGVDGTDVYGAGTYVVLCNGKAVGSAGKVEGTINPDGTFSVKHFAGEISIHGTVPAAGATEWSGSFTINPVANDPKTGMKCPAVSETFVAKKAARLSGKYSGALKLDGRSPSSDGTVSIDLEQGLLANAGHEMYVPLHAVIVVKNSTKFPSGTWTTDENPAGLSRVEGNQFSVLYCGKDGSMLEVGGGFFENDDVSLLKTIYFTYRPRGFGKDPVIGGFATLEPREN